MLNNLNFSQIDESTIISLIDCSATENVNLEFKRKFERTAKGSSNLRKVISAFANTLGGYLIIGLNEENGVASEICPVPTTQIDEEMRWLESVAYTNIEPRILGLNIKQIECKNYEGSIILIHVPRSYNPPHCVNTNESQRFYIRRNSLIDKASVEELRILFGQQRTLEEQATTFINGRFLQIQANNGTLQFNKSGIVLVLHLVPLQDFGIRKVHDIKTIWDKTDKIGGLTKPGNLAYINLEGVVKYLQTSEFCSYTQVFRNGVIESVTDAYNLHNELQLQSLETVEWLEAAITSHMEFLQSIDSSTPIQLQVSFLGMNQVKLAHPYPSDPTAGRPYDREELHLPPTIIPEYQENHNYQKFLQMQMNILWNAFGEETCQFFDEYGKLTFAK